MSGFFRAQVTLHMDTGTPADDVVNVWHFDSDQTFADDADDVAARLATFYANLSADIFSSRISGGTIKMYDMADAIPREPGYETPLTLSPAADASTIPNEVAICLSFKADPVAGVAPGRLRGRVFLGPCDGNVLTVVGSRVRVKTTIMQAIVDEAVALAVGPDAGDGRLSVFSPTIWAAEGGTAGDLDPAFNDVTTIWVDNAPDTIRSRGEKPDARIEDTVP